MQKFKLSALFILAALSIAAVGSASLSSVFFARSVIGKVLIDTADDVAIQIIAKDQGYKELIKTDEYGEISIDLSKAIDKNASRGFNTDAVFGIGSLQSGVIIIKNNSDVAVKVDSCENNMVSLLAANNTTDIIKPGEASEFSFIVNTKDVKDGQVINSTIQIKKYT
jgi:hypothetical protein